MNIATKITWSRIIFCIICYPLAYYGQKEWFLIVLGLAILTDGIDGWIARKYKQITEYGAKLDTIADHFLLISSAYWIYAFYPEIIDWLTIPTIFMIWIIFNNIICYYKHKRIANFHMYSAKLASGFLQFTILYVITFGFNITLYWISMILILIATIENMLAVFKKNPKTNMKSYFS